MSQRDERAPTRETGPAWHWSSHHLFSLGVPLVGLVCALSLAPVSRLPTDEIGTSADVNGLQARARRADDLTWLRAELGTAAWPAGVDTRSDLVHEKDRLRASGNAFGAASLSGILAAE